MARVNCLDKKDTSSAMDDKKYRAWLNAITSATYELHIQEDIVHDIESSVPRWFREMEHQYRMSVDAGLVWKLRW